MPSAWNHPFSLVVCPSIPISFLLHILQFLWMDFDHTCHKCIPTSDNVSHSKLSVLLWIWHLGIWDIYLSGDCSSLILIQFNFNNRVFLIYFFSNVFKSVDDNSKEIWKYHKYFLAMEYDNKSALAPPFSIIMHTYLVFKWIGRKTCCKKTTEGKHIRKWNIHACHTTTSPTPKAWASGTTSICQVLSYKQKLLILLIENEPYAIPPGLSNDEQHQYESWYLPAKDNNFNCYNRKGNICPSPVTAWVPASNYRSC